MLVLSRERDQSVLIGRDVIVTVVDVRGSKARLGITAPIETLVLRQELAEEDARRGDGDGGKPPAFARRHVDEIVRYRNALHMVLARSGQIPYEVVQQVRDALAGGRS